MNISKRRISSAVVGVALASLMLAPTAEAQIRYVAAGPPVGRYACYRFGMGVSMSWVGVTIDILAGQRYTEEGASFIGQYRFVPQGAQIVYVSGKLQGLKSWYSADRSGKAIYVKFKFDGTPYTAVCGMIEPKP